MERFNWRNLKESFERFEKAAMKGHEESQWIWNVVKDVPLEEENREAVKKAFAETENPLGYYFAGLLCNYWSRERLGYMKRSSDGGCSWGQVQYGLYFDPSNDGLEDFEKDSKQSSELMAEGAAQNNPYAIYWRGSENFRKGEPKEAFVDCRMAAELGWREAKEVLSEMFYYGDGVEKDLAQAVYWGSHIGGNEFWWALTRATNAWNDKAFRDLGCDFSRLAMEIGKGLYWYRYEAEEWEELDKPDKEFGVHCLDYYCETIELQQDTIFLFLLFWNKTTGVKGPGRMVGQMVWEGRYDCFVKEFGKEGQKRRRGMKRLKK